MEPTQIADPRYAPAYAALAALYNNLANYNFGVIPPQDAWKRAKAAAEHALEIDEGLASAHTSLALVAYQWEVGALFFPYILVLVFANRRWGVLTGFGMSLVVALVISFLTYPGWGLPYIRAVLSDWYRGTNINLNSIAAAWFPDSRFSVGAITSIVVGVIIFIEMVSSTQSHFRRIVWTVCLSLAATPLLGFAIFPSNHVVLIPALILILTLMWERWTRRRALAVLLVLSVAFLIPFGIYFRGTMLSDRLYSDLLSALPPIATILGLYWMRWWVLHSPRSFHSDHPTRRAGSPRTWSDQTGLHR